MAIEIIVPTLGESVSDATVARWMKASGDNVAADEPIVEQGCFSMMGTEVDRRVKQRLLLLTDAHHALIGWDAKGWKSSEMVNIDDFTSLFLLQTLPGMNQLVDRCC